MRANIDCKLRTIRPGSSSVPAMVCVFPLQCKERKIWMGSWAEQSYNWHQQNQNLTHKRGVLHKNTIASCMENHTCKLDNQEHVSCRQAQWPPSHLQSTQCLSSQHQVQTTKGFQLPTLCCVLLSIPSCCPIGKDCGIKTSYHPFNHRTHCKFVHILPSDTEVHRIMQCLSVQSDVDPWQFKK